MKDWGRGFFCALIFCFVMASFYTVLLRVSISKDEVGAYTRAIMCFNGKRGRVREREKPTKKQRQAEREKEKEKGGMLGMACVGWVDE